ncbi:MAG: FtsQ-type POTRA domain-containing protein [Spirochaetes bacterium]|nr:FtsQ-type POTRA domain-containing protein [Spirochaetota bacterium]
MIKECERNGIKSRKVLRAVLLLVIGLLFILALLRIVPAVQKITVMPVRTVQIYGNEHVTKGEIAQKIGIDVPSSILTFSRKHARSALLEDNRILSVETAKLYPDTLRIFIREKPAFSVIEAAGSAYWISADGTVLSEVGESDVKVWYPRITLKSNNDDIKIGIPVTSYLVQDILHALEDIGRKEPDFLSRISSFTVNEEGAQVRLEDDRFDVWFGTSVTALKLERLRALLAVLKSESLVAGSQAKTVEIDMSATYAAVRMREMNYEP